MQIAIQVRSKLSNPDDMSKFTIVASIPPRFNSNSIVIVSGVGHYDPMKRCITWENQHLPKGESFLVSAKCELNDTSESPEDAESNEGLDIPVMLRCTSNDQISPIHFEAVEATGYPAVISSTIVGQSFRIVHRV
jgi:hypothetical protein